MWFPSSYWDSAYDDDVMEHRVGLNLLYAQVRVGVAQPGEEGHSTPWPQLCWGLGGSSPRCPPTCAACRRCQTLNMDGSLSTRNSTGS